MAAWTTRLLLAAAALPLACIAIGAGPPDTKNDGLPLPTEVVARIGSGKLRHRGPVRGLCYSADGKAIVSIAEDNSLCLWDADTGKLLRHAEAKLEWRHLQALRMDGKRIDALSKLTLRAFDVGTGAELHKVVLGIDTSPYYQMRARFSADGTLLASGLDSDNAMCVRDAVTGKDLHRYPSSLRPIDMVFTPDNKQLAVIFDRDRTVKVLNAATGEMDFLIGDFLDRPSRLDLSPDGATLLVSSMGVDYPRLWDIRKRMPVAELEGPGRTYFPFGAAFSPDSRHVAIGSQWTHVAIFDTATGKELQRFPAGPRCLALAFSADGKRLVAGNHEGEISQWDAETGKPLASAEALGGIRIHRFQDGKQLLAGTGRLALFDVKTGMLAREIPGTGPDDLFARSQLAPDARLAAVADFNAIHLLDAGTGKPVRTLKGHTDKVARLLFAPDGKLLFSNSYDNSVRIWDTQSGKQLHAIAGAAANSPFNREMLAVSLDGKRLATAPNSHAEDGGYRVRVWDVASGRLVGQHVSSQPLADRLTFTPEGELLFVVDGSGHGKGDVAHLLEPATGTLRWSLSIPDRNVASIGFAPAGHTFAIGGSDGSLKLYETVTGRLRYAFEGHTRAVDSVAFTPSGSLLGASSSDAPVYLWDIYGSHARHRLPDKLTDEETQQLWQELAGPGAQAAFRAVRRLAQNPQVAAALLRQHLVPVERFPDKQFDKLIADLDSDVFDTRQQAFAELEKHVDRLEYRLRDAAATGASLELKRRVEALLARPDPHPPERLRQSRALEALEQMTAPEAVQVLEALAAGERGARLTRDAAGALARLRTR